MFYPLDVNSELDRALYTLKKLVIDGLGHGYFEFSLRCEVANGGRRSLTIIAGKSHKFSISPEDLKR